jgi:lipid-binding SYLF domain-containing protein
MRCIRVAVVLLLSLVIGITLVHPHSAWAASAAEIDRNIRAALQKLYANPTAKSFGQTAKAVLVFPSIVKGGFIVGASMARGLSS